MDYTMVTTGPVSDQGMSTEPGFINGGMVQRPDPDGAPGARHRRATTSTPPSRRSHERGGSTVCLPSSRSARWASSAYFTDSEGNLMGLWQTAGPRATRR